MLMKKGAIIRKQKEDSGLKYEYETMRSRHKCSNKHTDLMSVEKMKMFSLNIYTYKRAFATFGFNNGFENICNYSIFHVIQRFANIIRNMDELIRWQVVLPPK